MEILKALSTLILVAIGALGSIIAMIFLLGFILSYPTMLLWNGCVVPAIPAIHEVTWLQMWGIIIVCGILFKSSSSKTKTNAEPK